MNNILQQAILAVTENPVKGFFIDFGLNSPVNVITEIIVFLLGMAGVIAILFIIVGGYQYIVSGANEELAKLGKKRVTNAVLGLIIIILSYTIISVVTRTLIP